MSDFDKEKRTLDDLSGVSLPALDISVSNKRKPRTKEHNEAISKAKKEFYASEKGVAEKKARSERTKAFWASEQGKEKKERLRQKMMKKPLLQKK